MIHNICKILLKSLIQAQNSFQNYNLKLKFQTLKVFNIELLYEFIKVIYQFFTLE